MHYQDFAACIFDFDGVFINSEPLHAVAKRIALDHFKIAYPAQLFVDFKGRTDGDFFAYVVDRLAGGVATAQEMDAVKRQAYSQLFEQVPLVEGALSFLPLVRRCFKKLGLVTSAHRRDFGLADQKHQFSSWFDVIHTAEDAHRHKPDPEPYLNMLAALDVAGRDALVIEDTPNGIQSAKSAGCRIVSITTTFAAEALWAAGADWVVTSFAELGQELGIR